MRKFIPVFFGLTILTGRITAATFTIFGDRADTQVHKQGIFGPDPGQNQGQSGVNGGIDYSMVFVFQLPALAANEFIVDADFSFFIVGSASSYHTDLYGLAHRSLPDVLPSDWYTGTGDPNNTLIQAGLVPPSLTFSGRTSTSPLGDIALASFLNGQYASGAVGGHYIFLRLSTNATNPININTNFYYAADQPHFLAGVLGQDTLPRWRNEFGPKLDLTVEQIQEETSVPEPASVSAVIAGMAFLLVIRRQRVR
jgi:hypothetical protein